MRSVWHGPLVIKGVQTVEDARLAAEAGVEAIALSNHGGRQLDSAPRRSDLVAPVADAVGTARDHLRRGRPSGQRHRGWRWALPRMAGRAYLYGLGAAGERGSTMSWDCWGRPPHDGAGGRQQRRELGRGRVDPILRRWRAGVADGRDPVRPPLGPAWARGGSCRGPGAVVRARPRLRRRARGQGGASRWRCSSSGSRPRMRSPPTGDEGRRVERRPGTLPSSGRRSASIWSDRQPSGGGTRPAGSPSWRRAARRPPGADAGRLPGAAAEPRDRLDVHRRRRRVRPRAQGRPDDGARGARCSAGRRASTTWPTSGAIRATSTRGPRVAPTGWSYDDVLPYFKKSEGLAPSGDIVVDADAHNTAGPARRVGAGSGARRRAGLRRRRGGGRDPRGRLQRP